MSLAEQYQLICNLSQLMLDSARQERWADLLEFEKKREIAFQTIPQGVENVAEIRSEIASLIENILRIDAETTALTREWMKELGSLLNSVESSKKLHQAYGDS